MRVAELLRYEEYKEKYENQCLLTTQLEADVNEHKKKSELFEPIFLAKCKQLANLKRKFDACIQILFKKDDVSGELIYFQNTVELPQHHEGQLLSSTPREHKFELAEFLQMVPEAAAEAEAVSMPTHPEPELAPEPALEPAPPSESAPEPTTPEEEQPIISFECHICHQPFASSDDLGRHTESVHPFYECSMCSRQFSTEVKLKKHEAIHNPGRRQPIERSFYCKICKSNFSYYGNRKKHVHGTSFDCIISPCPIKFVQRCCLLKHLRLSHVGFNIPKGFKIGIPKCSQY